MRRAHTVEQVRQAEDALLGTLPEGALMTRAATGLAHVVARFLGRCHGARVLLLVGAGNNGGDALYAGAALARRGARVDALLLAPDRAHPGGLAALRRAGGRTVTGVGQAHYDVALDGIVGIGATGALRPEATRVVEALAGVPVVAVDTPSGVDVDTGRVPGSHVRATVTVTFGTHKVAHLVDPAAQTCGVVELVDIGLTLPEPVLEAFQPQDVAALLPRPAVDAHKYRRGVVGVRAGSEEYRGAAVLCVAGANSGVAGMVRYVPAQADERTAGGVAAMVQAAHPEVVVGAGRVQCWVVGSGCGASAADQLAAAVQDGVPVVVDADALAAVRGPLPVSAVLTPHAGELARMLGISRDEVEREPLRHARSAAERFAAVVLLKGRHTLAVHPDGRTRVATVGPPWLATAGSGDVLAGFVGALVAAGLDPFDAASVGSWVHGAAAALARPDGPLRAGEVAAALPELCARLLGAVDVL